MHVKSCRSRGEPRSVLCRLRVCLFVLYVFGGREVLLVGWGEGGSVKESGSGPRSSTVAGARAPSLIYVLDRLVSRLDECWDCAGAGTTGYYIHTHIPLMTRRV